MFTLSKFHLTVMYVAAANERTFTNLNSFVGSNIVICKNKVGPLAIKALN